jgi:uncharacterized membrane protein
MRSDAALATLAGGALAVAVPVMLRQTRVIARLPDVRWRGFDANRVTTSPEAYPLGVPDTIPASLLYATEMALVAARRLWPARRKWIDRALCAGVACGALGAAYYGYKMVTVERRACIYCLTAIALNVAMVPLAWRILRGRDR